MFIMQTCNSSIHEYSTTSKYMFTCKCLISCVHVDLDVLVIKLLGTPWHNYNDQPLQATNSNECALSRSFQSKSRFTLLTRPLAKVPTASGTSVEPDHFQVLCSLICAMCFFIAKAFQGSL